jgi:hypothetical protein
MNTSLWCAPHLSQKGFKVTAGRALFEERSPDAEPGDAIVDFRLRQQALSR